MDKETPLAFFSPHQAGYSASPDSTRLSLLHPIPEITRAERNILYKRLECAYSNTMKSLRRRLEDERGKNSRLWLEVERERERSRRMSSELEAFRALFVDKNECKRKRIMKSPGSMFRVLDVCMGDKITDSTIVKRVLDYVGPLQWLYVAGINRFWRGLYHCRDLTCTNPLEALTSLSRLYYSIRAGGLNIMMVQLQDKRREKRTLEWWAGAVSASQDVMKCVQELRGSNGVDLCCGTAFSGKLHVFQEVLIRNLPDALRPPHCHSILLNAARAPTPDVLKWLCEYMCNYPHSDDWWSDNGEDLMNNAVLEAAQFGRVDTLAWLFSKGYEHRDACFSAAKANHIETVEFLLVNGCSWGWDEGDCQYVRQCGATYETMQWLHKQPGFPCSVAPLSCI